jgi:hypothetical protein
MFIPRPVTAILLAAAVGIAAGCWPRVPTDIALSPNLAKVTYAKKNFFAPETGVVECDRAADGSLSNCRKMTVTFRKPGK